MNRRHCLGAFAGVASALLSPLAGAQSVRKPWPRARPTPSLELPSLDGLPWRLADERGHPVLLNFWATWCEPCRAEMPSLERLAAAQQGAGLRVIAANYREGEPAVRRFLTKTPLALPLVRDADGAAARAFGINIFPSTVAIDRRGRTLFVVVGEVAWDGPVGAQVLRDLL